MLDEAEKLGFEKEDADEIRNELNLYKDSTGRVYGGTLNAKPEIHEGNKFLWFIKNNKFFIFVRENVFVSICTLALIGCIISIATIFIEKKCEIPGCPAEVSIRHDYCIKHKCSNTSCENPSVVEGNGRYGYYCLECIGKASH